MPITTREARQLSTASEWPLIESSQPDRVRELTPARLKAKIGRARTLRNKYRDLAKRQHRKVQPRRTGRPDETLNVRTARKAELFEQVLSRFEKEAERQAARQSRATQTSATRKAPKRTPPQRASRAGAAKKMSRPAATRPPSKRRASQSSQVPKSAVSKRSGQHRIHAHVSNTTRRRQARRDSRGR